LQVVLNSIAAATPFNSTVIVGSNNSISASSPQTLQGTDYTFVSWSDGGLQSHNITAGAAPATYTATYQVAAPGEALPSPWLDQDIGGPGVAGSASYASGTFTVKGSGTDIWGTSDKFHYVYQPWSGNGTITARVSGIQNTNPWAKAGVMIRETLAENSIHAMMVWTSGNGFAFQRRSTTGGSSLHTAGSAAGAPYWVRLVRSGNDFSAYQSADGNSWTLVGTATLTMASNVHIGLAVTSHNNTVLNTSTFTNVSVTVP
jgi:regulation of enolase protein 1 (concanavalin A-like superfamily)